MFEITNIYKKIHYSLRIACALCFIGHGCFGIITKEIWTNYFAVFGIGHQVSFTLMPYVGLIDILCGIMILIYPIRAVVVWLVIWGFVTALLRPLSGEPFAEFLERFGNFGAPLALLISSGSIVKNIKSLRLPLQEDVFTGRETISRLITCLRFVVFFLLFGHGWLNLMEKQSVLQQYNALGFQNPVNTAQIIGLFEMAAATAILVKPFRYFVLLLFFWKVTSEFFYPKYEVFEWIERAGSYGSILALWFALNARVQLFEKARPIFFHNRILNTLRSHLN